MVHRRTGRGHHAETGLAHAVTPVDVVPMDEDVREDARLLDCLATGEQRGRGAEVHVVRANAEVADVFRPKAPLHSATPRPDAAAHLRHLEGERLAEHGAADRANGLSAARAFLLEHGQQSRQSPLVRHGVVVQKPQVGNPLHLHRPHHSCPVGARTAPVRRQLHHFAVRGRERGQPFGQRRGVAVVDDDETQARRVRRSAQERNRREDVLASEDGNDHCNVSPHKALHS